MPLISVVIPVHGVGDYLERCLDSVLREPTVPVEVIAVDDASPDHSGEILAARHDPRLRVITTQAPGGLGGVVPPGGSSAAGRAGGVVPPGGSSAAGRAGGVVPPGGSSAAGRAGGVVPPGGSSAAVGPGPARDLGAKEATGEYVWFVDGDDELAGGALAAVAAALTRLRPDVLVVDFESLYPDGTTRPSGGARYLAGPEAGPLSAHPALIHLTMTAWSKVFRRELLAGLGVSFGSSGPAPHEDVPVTTLALLTAEKIGVLDRVCYRYRRARPGSFLAGATVGNFNIFGSYQQVFGYLSAERTGVRAPVTPSVYAAVFERAIWHYTTLLPLVPRRRRREFFHRMSADFRRWRPAGFAYPPGPRGVKFRLVARDAYWAYRLLDPVNRLRVALRPGNDRSVKGS